MSQPRSLPLDYQATEYAYLERPNRVLLSLVKDHILAGSLAPRILDVGCGAGANARRIRELSNSAAVVGIEPNQQAAELARKACDSVFCGSAEQWLTSPPPERFDGVLLSDVIEHVVDPISLLRELARVEGLRQAVWIVSVPNYGVWYNRLRTLMGRFDYTYSGLYDRTHLRFFTRRSLRRMLRYCGFEVITDRCSPSLVQSAAPLLRRLFQQQLHEGEHLALSQSLAHRVYQRAIEPAEAGFCQLWPELLGFQIVAAARL